MSLLKKILCALVFLFSLNSTSAFAQSHNHQGHQGHQGHHQKNITSPFELKTATFSLHCVLKLHSQKEFCPHSTTTKDKILPVIIASDCGGKTSGGIPNTALFNYDFTEISSIVLTINDLKSRFASDQFFACHFFNDSLSPPPRTI
jgi:hypothetical protein